MTMTRRSMFKAGLSSMAYFTTMATTPNWIIKSANALSLGRNGDDRILIILQHAGGIDGLNTVIPRQDDVYYDSGTRPNIHVPRGMEINMDGLNGLHPMLSGLAEWYQKGNMAVMQNIGYMNPNLSHFTSTDIYEYADNPVSSLSKKKGWVARYFDNQCDGCDPGALDMVVSGKSKVPDSLAGSISFTPPAINRSNSYRLLTDKDRDLRLQAIEQLNRIPQIDPQLDFLQRTANAAQASIEDIARASDLETLVPEEMYNMSSVGRGLKLVSQIIRSGFDTRIFYVSQGGYDTHANQVGDGDTTQTGRHPELMADFDAAVSSFLTEMELTGNLDRVLLLTFSEFGRRIDENGSKGTDHGAANCMFAFGGVNGGVFGGQPDLATQIKGNLKFKYDFRSVYSAVIEDWFGGDAAPVFGQSVYDDIIQFDRPDLDFVRQPVGVSSWRMH